MEREVVTTLKLASAYPYSLLHPEFQNRLYDDFYIISDVCNSNRDLVELLHS